MVGASIASLDSAKADLTSSLKRPICIFTKHLQWLDYAEMADTVAAIGLDGVDLTVRPGGHVLPENVDKDLPRAVKALEKAGVQPLMMTTRINNADSDSEMTIKTAADLGFKFYRMGYLGYEGDNIREQLENYQPRLEKLVRLNQQYGMHGAYQNHAGTRVGGPVWDVWYMIKNLDPRYLGCQYDVRHATVEGGYSWPVGLKLLKDHIRTTVIKDFKWMQRDDGSWHAVSVPLGEGMVDFDQYFKIIREHQIEGPISIHYEYPVLTKEEQNWPHQKKVNRTIEVMKKDVDKLRSMLQEANLL